MTIREKRFNRLWPLIVILLLVVSVVSYAYWDNLEKEIDSPGITIGEGVTLVVANPTAVSTGNLVPTGAVLKDGDVVSIEYTYKVSLDKEVVNALNLVVSVADWNLGVGITPEEKTALTNGILEVQVAHPNTIHNNEETVTVTVSLNDTNLTEDLYNKIAGKTFTFTLKFVATE